MHVDVIIPSKTSAKFQGMVSACIQTLRESEEHIKFNVIVVETEKDAPVDAGQDITITWPDEEFNYNKALNLGINASENDWIVLANNDLIFHRGWFSEILKVKEKHPNVQSFCPWNSHQNWHENRLPKEGELFFGYRTSHEVAGWCIVINRSLLQSVQFTEECQFWYSDNIYAHQLEKEKLPHVLVRSSKVDHLHGITTAHDKDRYRLTVGQKASFDQYLQNKFHEFCRGILILVTTYNRPAITKYALTTLAKTKRQASMWVIDDNSDLKKEDLIQWSGGSLVVKQEKNTGIDNLRFTWLSAAISYANKNNIRFIYHTDNDIVHDPNWLERLWDMSRGREGIYSLFNSKYHDDRFSLEDQKDVIIRRECPGASFLHDVKCFPQDVADRYAILSKNKLPTSWDFILRRIINTNVTVSKTSYAEHYGADGIHNQGFTDRAINPTTWLREKEPFIFELCRQNYY